MKKSEIDELISNYDVQETGQIEYQDFIDLSELKSDQKVLRKRPFG